MPPSRTLRTLAAAMAGSAVLAVAAALYLGVTAFTPPFTDADGQPIPGSIAVLEKVELGGLDQWISIRGMDVTNPVLLWLHGGPGSAQMPLAHHLDRGLEARFVVVHWDQRGAGKSNHRGFDESTMREEQYVEDAIQLIEYLRERLGVDRVVLLGHSWGTQLGIQLVAAHPEYFHAYIGVSQVVNHDRATELARDWLRATIDPERAPADLAALEAIEVPARQHREFRKLIRLIGDHGGSFDVPVTRLARVVAGAPEYTVGDYRRLLGGMNRGGGPMHPGGLMATTDFLETIPVVDVPVYFFIGARDYNTPMALVREYYEAITAPAKELVVFESSAHLPFMAEPERFTREVIRVAGR